MISRKNCQTEYLDAYISELKKEAPTIFSDIAISMGVSDRLFIIDMQNDFIGHSKTSPQQGRFNVAEGDEITGPISELIEQTGSKGIKMVATRDYHPNGHVSFLSVGGPFPDHCVMGSHGSSFASDVKKALLDQKEHVSVIFKGCHEHIDSFGALPYDEGYGFSGRLALLKDQSSLSFTGGFEILEHDNPAMHPVLSTKRWSIEDSIIENPLEASFKKALLDCTTLGQFDQKAGCILRPKKIDPLVKNVFLVGLAADFCVLDSAINAKIANPLLNVFVIYDLTRYAWLPFEMKDFAQGPDFAQGRFITDVVSIANKYLELGVKLIHSSQIK